jgi:hypothetical protein
MELFKPRAGTIRKPLDNQQQNGQITNPPRYDMFGGLSGANKVSRNKMRLSKPGDTKKVY